MLDKIKAALAALLAKVKALKDAILAKIRDDAFVVGAVVGVALVIVLEKVL